MLKIVVFFFYFSYSVFASSKEGVSAVAFLKDFAQAAEKRVNYREQYDPTYRKIPYPMGDVPPHYGVCTDVLIRALRSLKIDLQELVHTDMKAHFNQYPNRWGLKRPDTNIDHRRVPNLETFFTRMGARLPLSSQGKDYEPGDIVTFIIGNRLPHIGVVTSRQSADSKRYLVVHNIGRGPEIEDILEVDGHVSDGLKMTAHFRYIPKTLRPIAVKAPNKNR